MRRTGDGREVDVEELGRRDPVGLWMYLATGHPEPYPTSFDADGRWSSTADYTREELRAAWSALRSEFAERHGDIFQDLWAFREFEGP